jgi:hypothetical protein
MIRHRPLAVMTWVFSWVVPRSEREVLLGDLAEEYAMRADAVSSSAAFKWYVRQMVASAPHLAWSRVTKLAWLATAAVGLLAYIAVGVVELIVNWAVSRSFAPGTGSYSPLGMLLTFPIVVFIGYLAATYRRGAAMVLGALMLLAVTVMTLSAAESVPTWYRIAYFCVGPAAVFIGSTWRSLAQRRP